MTQRLFRPQDLGPSTGPEVFKFFGGEGCAPAGEFPQANSGGRLARGARNPGEGWRRYDRYPGIEELGDRLGYDLSGAAAGGLAQRMLTDQPTGLVKRTAGLVYRSGYRRRLQRSNHSPLTSVKTRRRPTGSQMVDYRLEGRDSWVSAQA